MSYAALKLRLFLEPDTDLEEIKKEIEKRMQKLKAKLHATEEQLIGFGIKALIVTMAWPEKLSTDKAEKELLHIKGVSSIDVLDYRRALG